ncbi:hypothetical protein vseg_000970 [Gypsophila vaccaria]
MHENVLEENTRNVEAIPIEGLYTLTASPAIVPLQLDEILVEGAVDGWHEVTGRGASRLTKTVPLNSTVKRLKLVVDDVVGEPNYWKTLVVCCILGANPPFSVISGFIRRIWGKHRYDNISYLPNGIFVVHFPITEAQQLVLNGGYQFFDNKPLILKVWSPELPLTKQVVSSVPVWIRLRGLDLKYWGDNCLRKFTGEVGEFVRQDVYTRDKSHLEYARILVEMEMNKEIQYEIEFVEEYDSDRRITVEYEWLPLTCQNCGGFGHVLSECRRKGGTINMVWKRKETVPLPKASVLILEAEVTKKIAGVNGNGSAVLLQNNSKRPATYSDMVRSGTRGAGMSGEAVQPPTDNG